MIKSALLWACLFVVFSTTHSLSDPDPLTIKHVHLVFSNHFDAGFHSRGYYDSGYTLDVLNLYFNIHFPNIVSNIVALEQKQLSYIYTTHAWLVYLYLHCDEMQYLIPGVQKTPGANTTYVTCPNVASSKLFRQYIAKGQITWHAFPFNAQLEFLNPTMLGLAIDWVHALDEEFGLPKKTVISQRDVPGITAGAIPVFNNIGIRAVSIGVNTMSAPPAVPKVFRWQNPNNVSQEVFGLWTPGGYGWYWKDYCHYVDGWDRALAFYWRDDNEGPGSPYDVQKVYLELRNTFPNAEIHASTFEEYVDQLVTVKDRLPIVAAEIGDSWVHGLSSDPLKVYLWRETSRNIDEQVSTGEINPRAPEVRQFFALFLKGCEHTWGQDEKTFFGDRTHWSNDLFKPMEWTSDKIEHMRLSWIEQRDYLKNAIKLLPQIAPEKPQLFTEHMINKIQSKDPIKCPNWVIQFSATGGISHLSSASGYVYFNETFPIQFVHSTYSSDEVDKYVLDYGLCGNNCPDWYLGDFGKSGLNSQNTKKNDWLPVADDLYENNCIITQTMSMSNPNNTYGPPERLYLVVDLQNPDYVSITLTWVNKTSTRLPEAFWLSFIPIAEDINAKWTINKIADNIEVNAAVVNGSQHLHGQWGGIEYEGEDRNFLIEALDTAVVSIGIQSAFPTPFQKIDPRNGVHFLMWNNIWSTNYPLWYPFLKEDDQTVLRFRFTAQHNK